QRDLAGHVLRTSGLVVLRIKAERKVAATHTSHGSDDEQAPTNVPRKLPSPLRPWRTSTGARRRSGSAEIADIWCSGEETRPRPRRRRRVVSHLGLPVALHA